MKTAFAKNLLLAFLFFLHVICAWAQDNPFYQVPGKQIMIGKTFREIYVFTESQPLVSQTFTQDIVEGRKLMGWGDIDLSFANLDAPANNVYGGFIWERSVDFDRVNNPVEGAPAFSVDDVCDYETRLLKTIDKQAVFAYVEALGFTKEGDLEKSEEKAKNGKCAATFLTGYVMKLDDYYVTCHIVEYHKDSSWGWIYLQMQRLEYK